MTKFVYSRVLTIRETVNVFAPDEAKAQRFLSERKEDDWYGDNITAERDEELCHSSWALMGQEELPTCSVCGKDLVERPSVFGPYTVCAPCVRLARDLREQRFIDTIAEMVTERPPTTPAATAHTEPLEQPRR